MRHRIIRATLACATALALAACGEDSDTRKTGSARNAGKGFPVEIRHKYGTTAIASDPKRIVTVGYNDHEFVLALGREPVGIRDWVGVGPVTDVPWAKDRIAAMKAEPALLPRTELNVEQVAGLRPDLIIGIFGGMTDREYETLSRIAPTVAPPADFVDFGVPWQQQALITGEALGDETRAQRIVESLEGRFRRARAENPEFAGKRGLVPYAFEPGTFGAYASGDLRSRFIRGLGFEIPPRIDELAGDEFYVEFSWEQFRLLEQDALLLYGSPRAKRRQVEADPLYRRLDAVKEGRVVYLDNEDTLLGAVGLSTPFSLPYAIDEAVPRLAAAVDGDPATEVEEAE